MGIQKDQRFFWQLEKSTDGLSEACRVLDTPVIGGNVSLYNERSGGAVYPTPVIGMVGLVEDVSYITTQTVKEAGDILYVIGETKPEFGGSEIQKVIQGNLSGKAPTIDLEVEKDRQQQLLSAIRAGIVASAHDVAEGGMAVAIAEKLFGTSFGAQVNWTNDVADLFAESQSRFVVTVKEAHRQQFEQVVRDAKRIGTVTAEETLQITTDGETILSAAVKELESAWKGAIPCLLKSKD